MERGSDGAREGEIAGEREGERSCDVCVVTLSVWHRITHPARGSSCEHFNCFDLATYLEFCSRGQKWVCPVCNRPVLPWELVVCPGMLVPPSFSPSPSPPLLICIYVSLWTSLSSLGQACFELSGSDDVRVGHRRCAVFESILEAVATQPKIETCKIDKSGRISTGNNVQVKVKDGALRAGPVLRLGSTLAAQVRGKNETDGAAPCRRRAAASRSTAV